MIALVNAQIKGYVAPTGMGYGTWTDITPAEGLKNIITERNINGGDSAQLTLSSESDFTNFEQQRAVQIFLDGTTDPTNLIWEGIMLVPELGVHSPWVNLKTYTIQCVGYEKFLMRKEMTKEWSSASLNTIFGDLADEANANMRFPTVKRFKYDTSKLTNYQSAVYTETISKAVERAKVFNILKEMIPLLDGINTAADYEFGLYLDYMQSTSFIYLMPDMLYLDASPITDFTDESTIYKDSLTFKRNYGKVINFSHTIGDGYETLPYNTTLLSAVDVTPNSDNYDFAATGAPTQRSYLAIEIQNDGAGFEYGSFSIDGWDAPVPSNALSEDIYFYAPFDKTTIIYSTERYGDFNGATPFNISNMNGSTINVYQCDFGIAGKSINKDGISQDTPRRLDLDTQARVNNYSQQQVLFYHKPTHEVIFRPLNYNKTNYLNKTVTLTDPFDDESSLYLITKQRYVIPENYDVEQWLSGIHRDYTWE